MTLENVIFNGHYYCVSVYECLLVINIVDLFQAVCNHVPFWTDYNPNSGPTENARGAGRKEFEVWIKGEIYLRISIEHAVAVSSFCV